MFADGPGNACATIRLFDLMQICSLHLHEGKALPSSNLGQSCRAMSCSAAVDTDAPSLPWTRRATRLGGLLLAVVLASALLPPVAMSDAVQAASPPVSMTPPMLSGTPKVGKVLTCSEGVWAGMPTAFGYQWLRSGHPVADGSASTHLVTSADSGHSLSCQVTAKVEAGSYNIIGLPTSLYEISFQTRGNNEVGNYETTRYGSISVVAGAVTEGIDGTMPTGGEIQGTVSDAITHAGMPDVHACAETKQQQEACTMTNGSGEYTLSGLPSGSYVVWFTTDSGGAGWPWSEYYGGATTNAEAAQVPVVAGQLTTGIDIAATVGQISGTVTSASDHTPVARIEVCADSRTSGQYTRGCALTDASGRYSIDGLAIGSYTVQFHPAYNTGLNYVPVFYGQAALPAESPAVTVSPGATTAGVDAELQDGGQIAGTVVDGLTHAPIEAVWACAEPISGIESGPCANTNGSGQYIVSGLSSGKYKVDFGTDWSGVASDYLGQYFSGKASSEEAAEVSVVAGAVTDGVDAELAVGGQIAGTVVSAATGAGVSGIDVCAERDGNAERCEQTDAAGHYLVSGVAGGSHYVSFTRFPENKGDYLSQLYPGQVTIPTATPVPVTVGSVTAGIDAHLLSGGQITGRVTSSTGAGIGGVTVCASYTGEFSESLVNQLWGGDSECSTTVGVGASATANSHSLVVPVAPHSQFKVVKVRFDQRHGRLDVFLKTQSAGRFRWRLSFAVGTRTSHGARSRHRCRRGQLELDGSCRTEFAFSSGRHSVHTGVVEIRVRPSARARRALRARHLLHVSGTITFQSQLGGPPTTHSIATIAHD